MPTQCRKHDIKNSVEVITRSAFAKDVDSHLLTGDEWPRFTAGVQLWRPSHTMEYPHSDVNRWASNVSKRACFIILPRHLTHHLTFHLTCHVTCIIIHSISQVTSFTPVFPFIYKTNFPIIFSHIHLPSCWSFQENSPVFSHLSLSAPCIYTQFYLKFIKC